MILVFDFDGTIHETDLIYQKAMENTLGQMNIKSPNLAYKSLIGDSPTRVWKNLGIKDDKEIDSLVKKTGELMDYFMAKEGRLYEGALETLTYLKDKYNLILLSNCRNSYMDTARKTYDLDKFFTKFLTGEDYSFKEKYKILRDLGLKDYLSIGDRIGDVRAGFKNNEKLIFASYGYGSFEEGENADIRISDIRKLMKIL